MTLKEAATIRKGHTMKDWYGFRRVAPGPIFHGFKVGTFGAPSLCGRVVFGPEYAYRGAGRCCAMCSRVWSKRYPPRVQAPTPIDLSFLLRAR